MPAKTFDEFMARFDPDGTRVAADLTAQRDADGASPFVIVRDGRFTAVLALMPERDPKDPRHDHLCIDVFSFVDGQGASSAPFGIVNGRRVTLPDTGRTSHGFPATGVITSVLIGEQATE